MKKPNPPPGFTLIELLVVVAIIAILASLLMPALARAKRSSHVAACSSNLRQMGISIQVYATSFSDEMPIIWERKYFEPPIPGLDGRGRGNTMFGQLLKHTQIPMTSFRCPADPRQYELDEFHFWEPLPTEVADELNMIQFDYSANAVGWGMSARRLPWTIPKSVTYINVNAVVGKFKLSQIPNPSDMYLVWDGHVPTFTSGGGYNGVKGIVSAARTASLDHWWFQTVFRHCLGNKDVEKGPNAMLADGHVERRIDLSNLQEDNFNVPVR